FFFCCLLLPPPWSTLFPYTTLFRSGMGWRMGLLVSVMLPIVTLISLGIYDLGGGVLHQIAVIGVVIALGILIDNAIVMVENIQTDRKSTRLNSSHVKISYAVFCLKK